MNAKMRRGLGDVCGGGGDGGIYKEYERCCMVCFSFQLIRIDMVFGAAL